MPNYTCVLKLTARHSFYSDGLCRDLAFSPTAETLRVIQGHRFLVKKRPSGVDVFAPLNDGRLLIDIEKDTRLEWLIRPTSPAFYAFTALRELPPNNMYTISNDRKEGVSFDEFGGLVVGQANIGMGEEQAGFQQRQQNTFARLIIRLPKAFRGEEQEALEYELHLKAKKEYWQYLIQAVESQGFELNNTKGWRLKLSDEEKPEVTVLELDDQRQPPEDKAQARLVWQRLQASVGTPGQKAYFISTKMKLPYRERPLMNISLQDKQGNAIIAGLRSPGPEEHGLILHKKTAG